MLLTFDSKKFEIGKLDTKYHKLGYEVVELNMDRNIHMRRNKAIFS